MNRTTHPSIPAHPATILRATLLVAMAAVLPFTAQAQDTSSTPLAQRDGLYMGMSMGATGISTDSIGRVKLKNSKDTTKSKISTKIRVGYWFDEHWGVEAGATQIGRVTQAFDGGIWRAKGHAFQLSGLGRMALGEKWALIGKVSVTQAKLKDDGSSGNLAGFDQLNGSGKSVVAGGVGLEYALSERIALSMEVDGFGEAGKKSKPTYAGVGIRWAF